MQRGLALLATVACSAHDPLPRLPRPQPEVRPVPEVVAQPAPPVNAPGLRLPEGVTPLAYDLHLEVDPEVESFHGKVSIEVQIDAPTDHVWIHADELEISTASFRDGTHTAPLKPLAVAGDQMRAFAFDATIDQRTITLDFEYIGHTGHDEEGLFRQHERDRWYMFSQGESVFARRITPCFDEPRFKTPWKLTLVIPKDERGFANMPPAHETDLADGRHQLEFAETPPMASYLLAVAVGPFDVVDAGTVGKNRAPLRVIALHGDREHVGVVAARTPAIVDAIEKYTGDPLTWPKLDLVVVPHLFGAMENPGLITFDAPIVVGDPKHRGFSGNFTRIAAHEIAHQWFGNLVTPVWWDDLWLSESFASWLGDRVASQLGSFDQALIRQALTREHALEADAEPGARPLHRHIERNDDPDTFDTIAYDKGEVVLSTIEAWVGEAAFRAALRTYLHDHRDRGATTSDLIAAFAAASTPAAARSLADYVDHVGAPIVDLAVDCSAAPKLVAHARDGMTVPVCVRYAGGRAPERACTLVDEHTELALTATTRCPKWVYATETGYYHVAWSSNGARGPAPPLTQLAASERIALGDDLAAAISRGEVAMPAALSQLRELAASHDLYGEYAAIAIARAIDPIVDDATRDAWASWVAARFATRLAPEAWFGPPRSTLDFRIRGDLARIVADRAPKPTIARAHVSINNALAHLHAPDPHAIAITGGDRTAFDGLVSLAGGDDEDRREAALEALGEFGPALAPAAIGLVHQSTLPTKATLGIAASYFERGATRTAAWTAVRSHLPGLLAHLSGVEAGELIDDTASLCDPTARAEVAAAFEAHLTEIFDSRRRLAQALGAIDRCIARRPRTGDLAAALR